MDARHRHPGGRPRAFDEDGALAAATDVFWRLGYEGASMAELTGSMGINKPSLYATFGSKEQLFMRALQRYRRTYFAELATILAHPSAYGVLESYLRTTAATVRARDVPGCLSIQGGLACGPNNARIPQLLADYRRDIEIAVAEALSRTELAPGRDAESLARYAVTIGQGLAVDAAAGVEQARLDTVVDVALAGLANLLGEPA
ncbi:TetR/AcrR family transcriptional regulator [Mycobacterium sp. NPDC003323]